MSEPAFDNNLERSYLATVFLDQSMSKLAMLEPEDFAMMNHQRVYSAMLAMERRGERIEVQGLLAELGALEGETVHRLIIDLLGCSPVAHAPGAEKRLRQLRLLRGTRDILERAQRKAHDGDPEGALDIVEQETTFARRAVEFKVYSFGECASQAYQAAAEPDYETDGKVHLGIDYLHEQIGRLPPDSMMVVGGHTKAGKSSMLMRMGFGMAENGLRPGIISVEDSPHYWGQRAIALVSKVSGARMQREQLEEGELAEARKAVDHPTLARGRIVHLPDATLETAEAAIEHLIRREKCSVILLDYLQNLLLKEGANYHHVVGRAAKRLRMTTARFGVPLILGSQTKRLPSGQVPKLTDLKESGDIENQAKVVLLLHKDMEAMDATVFGVIAKCSGAHDGQRFEVKRSESGAFGEIVAR